MRERSFINRMNKKNKGSAARLKGCCRTFIPCGQRYGGQERVFMRGFAGAKTTGRDRLYGKADSKERRKAHLVEEKGNIA